MRSCRAWQILDSAPGVRRGFDELVPEHVSFDLFWKRCVPPRPLDNTQTSAGPLRLEAVLTCATWTWTCRACADTCGEPRQRWELAT